ncbi:MAG: hypothetical protein L3J72_04120, partial [Thermoplasmata archaeon]|nr:hypothetical protein [Thermoplasmata archaeon]
MSAVRWPLVREVLRKDLEEIARSRQLLYPLFVLPVFLTGDALLVFSTSVLSHNNPRLGLGDAFFSFASFLLVLPVILPILLGSA